MSSLCVLVLVLSMTLSKSEVIQTFFENSCGNESVPYSQSTNHTLQELSVIECGVQCATDVACTTYSYPPCVLHSEEEPLTCSSHQADNQTSVKQGLAPCRPPFELANNKQSCYFYNVTTVEITRPQLQQKCKSLRFGAHLVAVNTQQEHKAIKAYVTAADPTCQIMWTAGKTDNPAGLTDWYWDLGATTQNTAYFDWRTGEPGNQEPVENAIVILAAQDFTFGDAREDVSLSLWFLPKRMCFMCEVDLL